MANSIVNLATKWFEDDSGEYPAVVMGLNIFDAISAETFVDHVIEQFKNQRMCSPPETAAMTITIAGVMTSQNFCALWLRKVNGDPVLKHFMSMMTTADVLHIKGKDLLNRASLILFKN